MLRARARPGLVADLFEDADRCVELGSHLRMAALRIGVQANVARCATRGVGCSPAWLAGFDRLRQHRIRTIPAEPALSAPLGPREGSRLKTTRGSSAASRSAARLEQVRSAARVAAGVRAPPRLGEPFAAGCRASARVVVGPSSMR